MNATVVGKKKISFTSKDGHEINGANLHINYEENGVEGLAAEKFFISAVKFNANDISVGDTINVLYNKYGKVEKVEIVDDIDI